MVKRCIWTVLATALVVPAASAQEPGLATVCEAPEVRLLRARPECLLAAQAVTSAQPQLGILLSGGNPLVGPVGGGGLRVGLLPNVTASLQGTVVFARIPDLLTEGLGEEVRALNDALGIPVPAASGRLGLTVFPGASLAPTLRGVGSVTLLGNATWLPFSLLEGQGFESDSPEFAYAVGARVGLLGESFTVPGVSLSVMYHDLGRVGFGDVCRGDLAPIPGIPAVTFGGSVQACPGGGDVGEFAFDLTDWSGRLAVGKRFLGLGLTAGVGYDRFSSDIAFGFRSPEPVPGTSITPVFTTSDLEVEADRWSAFADLSYTFLAGTLAAEVGWMAGGDPVRGFSELATEFDPGEGTWFGSLGLRLTL